MKQVLEHVMEAYDNVTDITDQEVAWITDITQNKHRQKTTYCEICGSKHCTLEEHHIAGHKHSSKTITVCTDCHRYLSERQNLYPTEWLKKDDDPNEVWLTLGLIDVFMLKFLKSGLDYYLELARLVTRGFKYE